MLTGSWKNFTDSERMKAPKTGCLLKFKKAKTSISLDSRFIDLENAGFSATLSQNSQTCCFGGQMRVLACRLGMIWSQDKSMRKVFTCFVCVLMMWSDCGWSLGEGGNLLF